MLAFIVLVLSYNLVILPLICMTSSDAISVPVSLSNVDSVWHKFMLKLINMNYILWYFCFLIILLCL